MLSFETDQCDREVGGGGGILNDFHKTIMNILGMFVPHIKEGYYKL